MTQLWQMTITSVLDENGDEVVDYEIEDTVSVASIVGHLEVIKIRIVNEALYPDEESTDEG